MDTFPNEQRIASTACLAGSPQQQSNENDASRHEQQNLPAPQTDNIRLDMAEKHAADRKPHSETPDKEAACMPATTRYIDLSNIHADKTTAESYQV